MVYRMLLSLFVLILLFPHSVYAQGDAGFGETALPLPVGGRVFKLNASTLSAMQTAGMTWVRHFVWFRADRDLTPTREFVEQAHQAGFKVLLTIRSTVEEMEAFGDEYVPRFAAFAGEVAALGADAIEVWYAQNIDREWPGQVNGANYVRLLAAAYDAIKTASPNTLVISGALAPTGFAGAAGCTDIGCNDDVYAQQMADAGAASFADCIGVQYTDGAVSPAQTSGDPRGDYPTLYFPTMIERAIAPFEGQGIPLCVTWLAYLSAEGYEAIWPDYLPWARETSVIEQAKWLRDAVLVAQADGRVALLIIETIDSPGPDAFLAGSAIIRPDGTCPACQAIGSLANLPEPSPSPVIMPGEEVIATINSAAPVAVFTLQSDDPSPISVSVDPAPGSELDPVLIIYDSAGNLLAFNDDSHATTLGARVDQLPGDQPLTAVIYAFNETSTGDFILRFGGLRFGTIAGTSNANVRSGPGTQFGIVTSASPGTDITIRGRSADGSWLAVTVGGVDGWIADFLVTGVDDISSLPVLE